MPIVDIGGTLVHFPDELTGDALNAAVGKAAQQMSAPRRGMGENVMRGIGLGVRDVLSGAAQLPGLVVDAVNAPINLGISGVNAVAGTEMPQIRPVHETVTGFADAVGLPTPNTQEERRNSAVIQPVASVLTGVGAGAALGSAGAALGSRSAQAIGRTLTTQPATQAASAAAGGYVADATDSPWAGAAAALATPFAIGAGRSVISPFSNTNSPSRQALVRSAGREGIPLTAGQATGNKFLKNIESQFEQLPFTAGPQQAIREAQQRSFIAAAWRRAGEAADDTLPPTINTARNRIGQTIGAIANRNTLRFTPQLDNELQQITDSLRFIPAEAAGPVRARIEQLRGMVSPSAAADVSPTVPGSSYRMLDSQLGRSIRSTTNGDLRGALGDLRTLLRTAMDASISPADATAWQEARRQYANMSVIANAAGRAGGDAAEGMMSPVALRQALDTSTGGGYAFGRGDMNELSRMGQSLLRQPPDSGTGGRTFANNLLTGSLVGGGAGSGALVGGPLGAATGAVGALALPRLVQMAMNSRGGQAYLRNQIAAGPTYTRDLANALLLHQGGGLLGQSEINEALARSKGGLLSQ